MAILHLDSAITGDASASRQLSAAIVSKLTEKTPGENVVYRDLAADPLPHFTLDATDAGVLNEYLAADTVVTGAPLYNFGVSSQLKAWIDRILVPGRTFAYTADGIMVSPDHREVALADAHTRVVAL